MTEEQKRFKITKRESYEEQISEENKSAVLDTFVLGCFVIGAICFLIKCSNLEPNTIESVMYFLSGTLMSITSVLKVRELIETISKKTLLEDKLEQINAELEIPEAEESRGMIKW